MSIYEISITNPKKQLEFYKQLSEQLQQENKQLQEELEYTIGIVEHNRIISEKNKEIHQLKDNWNKLKEIAKSQSGFKKRADLKGGLWFEVDDLLDKMQEMEK